MTSSSSHNEGDFDVQRRSYACEKNESVGQLIGITAGGDQEMCSSVAGHERNGTREFHSEALPLCVTCHHHSLSEFRASLEQSFY